MHCIVGSGWMQLFCFLPPALLLNQPANWNHSDIWEILLQYLWNALSKIQLSVVSSNWNHSDIWEILLAIFVKYTFKNYVQLSVVSSPSTHIFLWKPLLSALLVSWPQYDTLSLVSRWTLYYVHCTPCRSKVYVSNQNTQSIQVQRVCGKSIFLSRETLRDPDYSETGISVWQRYRICS